MEEGNEHLFEAKIWTRVLIVGTGNSRRSEVVRLNLLMLFWMCHCVCWARPRHCRLKRGNLFEPIPTNWHGSWVHVFDTFWDQRLKNGIRLQAEANCKDKKLSQTTWWLYPRPGMKTEICIGIECEAALPKQHSCTGRPVRALLEVYFMPRSAAKDHCQLETFSPNGQQDWLKVYKTSQGKVNKLRTYDCRQLENIPRRKNKFSTL